MLLLGLMFFQTWLFETATSVRLQRIEHVVGLKESWTKADTPPVNELEFLRSTSQCGSASGRFDSVRRGFLYCKVLARHGQVAQLVERGPEKAGVGGSIPSLATIFSHAFISASHQRTSNTPSDFFLMDIPSFSFQSSMVSIVCCSMKRSSAFTSNRNARPTLT